MVHEPKKPLPLIEYLNTQISEDDLVLDIGCGTKVISSNLTCAGVTTLDAWQPFQPDIWCNMMSIPRLRKVETSKGMENLIDDYITQGYEILDRGERSAMARKKTWGGILPHIIVFIFLGCWTFLVANIIYALYAHYTAETVLNKLDDE